jgi:hypothetical protein
LGMWIRLVLSTIGTTVGISWTRQWTFAFHKMQGISWLAERTVSFTRRILLYRVIIIIILLLLCLSLLRQICPWA